MSLGARATVVISSFLAATMPDLASIIVYLLIRRHVLITERESAGEGEGEGGEPPFGGIYVGESSSNEAMGIEAHSMEAHFFLRLKSTSSQSCQIWRVQHLLQPPPLTQHQPWSRKTWTARR